MIVLGNDETECWLAPSTLTKMLNFCLNYAIGQLNSFLFSLYPHQGLSMEKFIFVGVGISKCITPVRSRFYQAKNLT